MVALCGPPGKFVDRDVSPPPGLEQKSSSSGPPGKFVNRAVSPSPGLEQQSSMLPLGLELSSNGVTHADIVAFALRNAQLKEEVALLQSLEAPALYAPWNAGRAWATWPDEPAWPTWPKAPALLTGYSSESTNCRSSDYSEVVVVLEKDRTTVIVKELPLDLSRDNLVKLMEQHGYAATYDFVYIPHDFKQERSFGYAFVSFETSEIAESFLEKFDGFTAWGFASDRVATTDWVESNHGIDSHIERYRNSPTLHESVPDSVKPALYKNGQRVPFPTPTKTLKAPRLRK